MAEVTPVSIKYPREISKAELGGWGSAWCLRKIISLPGQKSPTFCITRNLCGLQRLLYRSQPQRQGVFMPPWHLQTALMHTWTLSPPFLHRQVSGMLCSCWSLYDPCVWQLVTFLKLFILRLFGFLSLLPHAHVEGEWNAVECEGHRPSKALVGAQQLLPRELWSYSAACSVTPVLSPFNAIHLHKTTSPTCCFSQGPFPACEQSWML